jgi:hypothetical protein
VRALDLADESAGADIVAASTREELAQKHLDFQRLLRRLLAQGKDEVLYGAIELARDESLDGYRYLRSAIEEGAANLLLRRDDAPTWKSTPLPFRCSCTARAASTRPPTSRTATPTTRCWPASPKPGWKAPRPRWCWSATPTTSAKSSASPTASCTPWCAKRRTR